MAWIAFERSLSQKNLRVRIAPAVLSFERCAFSNYDLERKKEKKKKRGGGGERQKEPLIDLWYWNGCSVICDSWIVLNDHRLRKSNTVRRDVRKMSNVVGIWMSCSWKSAICVHRYPKGTCPIKCPQDCVRLSVPALSSPSSGISVPAKTDQSSADWYPQNCSQIAMRTLSCFISLSTTLFSGRRKTAAVVSVSGPPMKTDVHTTVLGSP